mmetsp:Transcript_14575/g.23160  ORF Transcript_14575/g.23160 Transcript_14575/m.23160 type:complete len:214 (+) Transcript_14575:527-1168(+)
MLLGILFSSATSCLYCSSFFLMSWTICFISERMRRIASTFFLTSFFLSFSSCFSLRNFSICGARHFSHWSPILRIRASVSSQICCSFFRFSSASGSSLSVLFLRVYFSNKSLTSFSLELTSDEICRAVEVNSSIFLLIVWILSSIPFISSWSSASLFSCFSLIASSSSSLTSSPSSVTCFTVPSCTTCAESLDSCSKAVLRENWLSAPFPPAP